MRAHAMGIGCQAGIGIWIQPRRFATPLFPVSRYIKDADRNVVTAVSSPHLLDATNTSPTSSRRDFLVLLDLVAIAPWTFWFVIMSFSSICIQIRSSPVHCRTATLRGPRSTQDSYIWPNEVEEKEALNSLLRTSVDDERNP
jgi:hypothetical protein